MSQALFITSGYPEISYLGKEEYNKGLEWVKLEFPPTIMSKKGQR